MYQTWCQTLISSQIDSTALTASTTPTTILPPAAHLIIPANFFQIGQVLRLRAYGRITTVVTTPGTLALAFMLGPTSNISVFTPAAMALTIVAQTNASWFLEMMLTCRAIGASTSANLMGVGQFTSRATLNAPAAATTLGVGTALLPDTAPAVGTGFDSTVANIADLFATWSLNNANSILTHQYTLESMN